MKKNSRSNVEQFPKSVFRVKNLTNQEIAIFKEEGFIINEIIDLRSSEVVKNYEVYLSTK